MPGLSPRSPLTRVAPVLVTVEPARTANVAAAPRGTGAGPAAVTVRAADAVPPGSLTVRGGTVRLTLGGVVLGVAPVVKLQLKSVARALPARSLALVVIVAVYTVLGARVLTGLKVAVTPT